MNLLAQIEAEEKARLIARRAVPEFQPGDTLRINVRIKEGERERLQAFEGVCIARAGGGVNESFTVRKISFGEGVERVFPVLSPNIESIEVKRRGIVRRAKLYYLRDRRGKSARIAERQTVRFSGEQAGQSGTVDRGGKSAQPDLAREPDILKMASAFRTFLRHNHASSGIDVRSLVGEVLDLLPESPASPENLANAHRLAVGLSEHLSPLMFSDDRDVADLARDGMLRLARLFFEGVRRTEADILARFLRHLDQRLICHIKIKPERHGVDIHLSCRDLVRSATKERGLAEDEYLSIQMFLEDTADHKIREVGRAEAGHRHSATLRYRAEADTNTLAGQFITILADGSDVYSTAINRPSDVLFIV